MRKYPPESFAFSSVRCAENKHPALIFRIPLEPGGLLARESGTIVGNLGRVKWGECKTGEVCSAVPLTLLRGTGRLPALVNHRVRRHLPTRSPWPPRSMQKYPPESFAFSSVRWGSRRMGMRAARKAPHP